MGWWGGGVGWLQTKSFIFSFSDPAKQGDGSGEGGKDKIEELSIKNNPETLENIIFIQFSRLLVALSSPSSIDCRLAGRTSGDPTSASGSPTLPDDGRLTGSSGAPGRVVRSQGSRTGSIEQDRSRIEAGQEQDRRG